MDYSPTAEPAISVITPCYKQGRYLANCIESVLSQNVDAEMIVVNDGSPDETDEVAAQFDDRIRYLRQENSGLAAARNAGFRLAAGRYVVFLDADDELADGALDLLLETARESPEASTFCGGYWEMDTEGRLLRKFPPPEFGSDALHALLKGNVAPPACFMVRREALVRAGMFSTDPIFRGGHEDWDLWLRVAKTDPIFAAVPGEVCVYRVSENSMSHNVAKMFSTGIYTLNRARDYHERCAACRMSAQQGRERLRRFYAGMGFGGGLDRASTLAGAWAVIWQAMTLVAKDPSLLPYVAKAAVLRPWRRGVAAKAIRMSTGAEKS